LRERPHIYRHLGSHDLIISYLLAWAAEIALAHATGISPLRGSLRAAQTLLTGCHPYSTRLSLDRSTIIGGQGRCETACHNCFGLNGNRWAPYLAVFDANLIRTGGLGAFDESLFLFQRLVR